MDHSFTIQELEHRIKQIVPEWNGKVETWDEISKQPTKEIMKKLQTAGFIPFLYELNFENGILNGHWMLILNRNEAVEVFDSHGTKINPLDWYKDKDILKHVKGRALTDEKIEPILSNKLFDCGFKFVDWNNKQLQIKKDGINTCGRWVLFRLFYHILNPNKDIDDFVDFALRLSKNLDRTPDEMIIVLF